MHKDKLFSLKSKEGIYALILAEHCVLWKLEGVHTQTVTEMFKSLCFRIKRHQSEKGIIIVCFPRGQLKLNCCFVIGP